MRAPDTVRMKLPEESADLLVDTLLNSPALIDRLIANIDERLGCQLDAILHHPDFQGLESAWRGLKFVVDRSDTGKNAQVHMWQCSKSQLQADLEDNPVDRTKTTFFRTVYSREYGQHGGKPYSAIFASFSVSSSPADVELLKGAAAVAAMAHAPLFVNAAPELFAISGFEELGDDIQAIFEAPRMSRWNTLREAPDSRYLAIVLPRLQLRLPYRDADESAETFVYDERVTRTDDHLWGGATFALAVRIADSHARYGTAMGMIGTFYDKPPVKAWHAAMTADALKPPVDVVLSRSQQLALAELGYIVLTCDPIQCTLGFSSAHSLQIPEKVGGRDGPQETLNHSLAAQIPYLLFASRFAHIIKIMQRELLGGHETPDSIARILTEWMQRYVNTSANPPPSALFRYPLRAASVLVREIPGEPGWYGMILRIWPHMRYKGADIGLELPGRLDRR